jgi:CO dehydrogenase maturation factor
MAKIVTVSGKGGVGKTTTTALLLDEMARAGYPGKLLVVDGDPAMTLYEALGLAAPPATVANIRDDTRLDARTIQALPAGISPAGYVAKRLLEAGVLNRQVLQGMPFDMLAMGWHEGSAGCFCSINNMLGLILQQMMNRYDLVIIDNEAGLEHLSRYRVKHVDLFLVVYASSLASRIVAGRIRTVAEKVGMTVSDTVGIYIAAPRSGTHRYEMTAELPRDFLAIPFDPDFAGLTAGNPVIAADIHSPVRAALGALVTRVLNLSPAAVKAGD